MACPLPISYTAASSAVSFPTNKLGSKKGSSWLCKMVPNALGDILQPQPAPWLYWVSLIGCSNMMK
ncbi:hypothetical protein F544_14010 [Bibersteinia trehalosi USDA-ARS-USMARC-190]|uniref:Uncharacterized protein n=1 Tax=Bibersteinia trehalosi USDA-ARS-USMARC-190 TaxID=1263832 RepID=W0R663_BIBTR|nr:hypothetical protein F544_14010 [Bibersteinia trehalosi USDA-ARS-USMARC-190]